MCLCVCERDTDIYIYLYIDREKVCVCKMSFAVLLVVAAIQNLLRGCVWEIYLRPLAPNIQSIY